MQRRHPYKEKKIFVALHSDRDRQKHRSLHTNRSFFIGGIHYKISREVIHPINAKYSVSFTTYEYPCYPSLWQRMP